MGKNLKNNKQPTSVLKWFEDAISGLIYLSETDADFETVNLGPNQNVSIEDIAKATNIKTGAAAEEITTDQFFGRLTNIGDGSTPQQTARAKRFSDLKQLIEASLSDVKVFRFGDIQIDIYIVGLDSDGNLCGIKTKAVET